MEVLTKPEQKPSEIDNLKTMIKGLFVKSLVTKAKENISKRNSENATEETKSVESELALIRTNHVELEDISLEFEDLVERNDMEILAEILRSFNYKGMLKEKQNITKMFINQCLRFIPKVTKTNPRNDVKISVSQLDSSQSKPQEESKEHEYASRFDDNFLDDLKIKRKTSKSLRAQFTPKSGKYLLKPSLTKLIDRNGKGKKNGVKCTEYGQLLILFTSNLILCNQLIEAVKVIEEYGLKYKEDKLTLANMHRLFS